MCDVFSNQNFVGDVKAPRYCRGYVFVNERLGTLKSNTT